MIIWGVLLLVLVFVAYHMSAFVWFGHLGVAAVVGASFVVFCGVLGGLFGDELRAAIAGSPSPLTAAMPAQAPVVVNNHMHVDLGGALLILAGGAVVLGFALGAAIMSWLQPRRPRREAHVEIADITPASQRAAITRKQLKRIEYRRRA